MNTQMEEVRRARGTKLPCPRSAPTRAHPPRSSLKVLLRFLWRPPHVSMISQWLHSSSSPLSGGWGMGLKVPSFYQGLVFLETSPHPGTIQEPTWGHPIKTKVSYHPGNSNGVRSSVLRTRDGYMCVCVCRYIHFFSIILHLYSENSRVL